MNSEKFQSVLEPREYSLKELPSKVIFFGGYSNRCGHEFLFRFQKETGDIPDVIDDDEFFSNQLFYGNGASIESLCEDIENSTGSGVLFTMNPMILNFFSDEFAQNKIFYRLSNDNFYPAIHRDNIFKLGVLGPGEVVCDTEPPKNAIGCKFSKKD